jgi:hypothetical protein
MIRTQGSPINRLVEWLLAKKSILAISHCSEARRLRVLPAITGLGGHLSTRAGVPERASTRLQPLLLCASHRGCRRLREETNCGESDYVAF